MTHGAKLMVQKMSELAHWWEF